MLSSTVTRVSETPVGMTPASGFEKLAQNEERWISYLDGVRARRAESLASLYDETSSLLYGLALRILNDPADAEEVVLDAYQQVWKSIESYDPSRGTTVGWLMIITRTRAIDRLRSAGTRRAREIPIDADLQMPSAGPTAESQSIFEQERKLIRRTIETLAPEQREAIELAYFRGLTHVEVAEALGAPLGTIKTRIRGGMRKLREALAPGAAGRGGI